MAKGERVVTITKTTTTVTTVTTMSIEVPDVLSAPNEIVAVAKAVPNPPETVAPKSAPPSRPVGNARRTKPKSALAKLEAKELRQARAERRFADHRRQDNADRMMRLRAGEVCFD